MQNHFCLNCGSAALSVVEYSDGCISICTVCGLQWAFADKKQYGGYLAQANQHYINPSSLRDPTLYPPFVQFFKTIGRYIDKPSFRLLDIGCGGGGFLAHCLTRDLDCWGVEANKDMGRFMPEQVMRRVHFGLAEDFAVGSGLFDVITFWDSFEHIECAFDVLDRLRPRLSPGGVVYLRVNNNWDIFNLLTRAALCIAPPLGKRLLRRCFNYPDHCWNFSQKAMTSMLARRGWKVMHAEVGETPSWRLTDDKLFMFAVECSYLVNRIIRGGKVGNYYITRDTL